MRVTGPMLSFGASGSIGGTATFATWKGRPYVRQLVIPSNPKSPLQTAQRAMMGFLSQAWKLIGDVNQSSWFDLAQQTNVSGFNAYTKQNLNFWTLGQAPSQNVAHEQGDAAAVVNSGGVMGGPKSVRVNWTYTSPGQNWGWVAYRKVGAAPAGSRAEVILVRGSDASAPDEFTDTKVIAGTDYYYAVQPFSIEGVLGSLVQIGNGIPTG